ncbi:hypothetical protein [Bacillus sp. FJAT-29790]|uniref:hypothetical protein n=1 Tax=Bacillus sp. FJAT-29790 TaxID=1895002 RepID=UPI0020B1F0C7|nr:hypothetical protein [Bacillus sp. FJAT-29790]
MNNLQRLELEVQGIELSHEEIQIYLEESGLKHYDEYKPNSNLSKRSIYKTALSVLESIANQPSLMKNYKQDDMSISEFADTLQ